MTTTTITAKGQIVIPSRIRHHLKIKPGARFVVHEQGNKIVIEPFNAQYFDQIIGMAKGTDVTRRLLKERQQERSREEKKWLSS